MVTCPASCILSTLNLVGLAVVPGWHEFKQLCAGAARAHAAELEPIRSAGDLALSRFHLPSLDCLDLKVSRLEVLGERRQDLLDGHGLLQGLRIPQGPVRSDHPIGCKHPRGWPTHRQLMVQPAQQLA